ncbi:PAS domain S-box protein [Mucilaginibacter sp.]|uniref:PAS domain S-box protein n=1 Tax=Mucilaginibacter sp. TaxID=1882438 RepID=UPI0025E0B146|nr:PAS domain S-box protein [Mucilaginibacter sp.]
MSESHPIFLPIPLVGNKGEYTNNYLANILYNELPVAVYTCDSLGYITSYNIAAEKLWGRKPEIGKDLWCGSWKIYYLNGKPMPLHLCPMARTLKEGVAIEGEEIIVERPDGTRVKVKPCPAPVFNEAGILTGAINTLIDVTRLTEGEEKQAMLAAIVNSSDDTIISKTLDGIITSWNPAAERMFGFTANEAVGKHISLIIPPSRIKEEEFIIGQITKGNKLDHFETIRVAKDGHEIPISITVSPIIGSRGKVIGASKIARDITERKKAEEKQSILASIIDTSDDTILSKTLGGIITSWNRAAEKMFGYTEAEVLGKHISLIIPPVRMGEEEFIIGEIIKGNRVDHFQTIRIAKDGHEVPISLSISPITDSTGKIIGASKIARDISEQQAGHEATRTYTKRLEVINTIIETISEELDLNKIIQKVTDATTELTGAKFGAFFYNTVDAKGESMMLYTLSGAPKEAFEKFSMPRNTAVFNPTFSGHGVVRSDDITKDPRYGKNTPYHGMPEGHLPVVSYLAVPVISRGGAVIGGLFFGHPEAGKFTKEHENLVSSIAAQAAIGIDNAKLYEEAKVLNDKKDEFIGLASHELKTPLTSISAYLQILHRLETNENSKRFVDKTMHQVKKLITLVNDLLDVSKIEAGKMQLATEKFEIKTVVENAIELIQQSNINYQIILESKVHGLKINGDPHRIEQVLINLLTNAIKYSPKANKVEVFLSNTKDQVTIGVKDYGLGIAADKLSQIFSRFFRIEGNDPGISGLGIGLYLTSQIVDRHNGKIWAESELGKGSTFWVTLPI